MRIEIAGRPHLTYCTNIHSGETWPEILKNIEQYVLQVKMKVAPDCAYGIGLRLSGQAAQTLAAQKELDTFRQFLLNHNLYVFTINGFPQGTFHGAQVARGAAVVDRMEAELLTVLKRGLGQALGPSVS